MGDPKYHIPTPDGRVWLPVTGNLKRELARLGASRPHRARLAGRLADRPAPRVLPSRGGHWIACGVSGGGPRDPELAHEALRIDRRSELDVGVVKVAVNVPRLARRRPVG